MRIIECDRCHKRIKNPKKIGYVGLNWRDPKTDEFAGRSITEDMDFCDECMDKIANFIANGELLPAKEPEAEPETVPEPEEEPKNAAIAAEIPENAVVPENIAVPANIAVPENIAVPANIAVPENIAVPKIPIPEGALTVDPDFPPAPVKSRRIDVGLIRRLAEEGKSISAICDKTGYSYVTVKKYLGR